MSVKKTAQSMQADMEWATLADMTVQYKLQAPGRAIVIHSELFPI